MPFACRAAPSPRSGGTSSGPSPTTSPPCRSPRPGSSTRCWRAPRWPRPASSSSPTACASGGSAPMSDPTTRGYAMSKEDYTKRLNRIEGQVRGIRRMIEDDTYCIDVLTQVSAVTKALQAVAVGLLDEHVRHCVKNAVADGDPQALETMVAEATKAIERLVKA